MERRRNTTKYREIEPAKEGKRERETAVKRKRERLRTEKKVERETA